MLEYEQKCLLTYKILLNCLSGKIELSICEKIGVIFIFASSPCWSMCYSINLSLTTSRFSAEKPSQTNPNTGNPCLILSPVLFVFASFCSFALLDFVLLVKQVPFLSSTEAKCSLLGYSPLLLSTTSWCKGQLKSMEEIKPEKTRSLFSPEGSDASLLPSHTNTHIRIITLPPSCSHHITFSCVCERLSWAAGNV